MPSLNARAWLSLAVLVGVIGLLLFGCAGTLRYWHAWVYLSLLIGISATVTLDLMRRDPAVLERRMTGGPMAEPRPLQRALVLGVLLGFIGLLVVPALDFRFKWSAVSSSDIVSCRFSGRATESLSMYTHKDFARQTIELARQARLAGNHPFGALLVVDGKVTLTAQNTVVTDCDPTAHAETNLVAKAIRDLSADQIRRSVLYTSCEPCAMCVGKMYWAGIRSIAYALSAEELAALAGRDFLIPCTELFARAVEPVTITGPLLLNEARRVHLGFWSPPAV